MLLKYSTKRGHYLSKETIKDCDKGFKAMRRVLVLIAWKIKPLSAPIIWFLSCFYRQVITKESIEYDLYLINSKEKTINLD